MSIDALESALEHKLSKISFCKECGMSTDRPGSICGFCIAQKAAFPDHENQADVPPPSSLY